MKKSFIELKFLKFLNKKIKFILALIFLMIIFILGYNFFDLVKAANLNYFETFTTTLYKDLFYTSAHWQSDGQVYLAKEWVHADGSKSYIENISNDTYESTYPLIFLDNKNQPYLVWEGYQTPGNRDILFTRGNLLDLQWERMDGAPGVENISNSIGTSTIDRVAVNSLGYPYIVWQDNTPGNNDIFFSYWNGLAWSGLDNTDGLPAYDNLSNTLLESKIPRIALDSNSRPYVVWDENVGVGNNEIYFTHWDGSKWAKMNGMVGYENLSNNTGESSQPRIILGKNNLPYIMWTDNTSGNFEIFFTKWTTGVGWTRMDGVTLGNENISNTSGTSTYDRLYDNNFVLDLNNNPYICWRDDSDGGYDIYFSHWTGSQWASMDGMNSYEIISNPALVSSRMQLVLNTNNFPQIVWISDNNLYFSHWTGSQWQGLDGTPGYQLVSASFSGFPNLIIDSADNLYISWLNGISPLRQVFVTKSSGTNWTKMNGNLGFDNISNFLPWDNQRPYLALAPNNNLYVTWQTGSVASLSSEIYFTYWDADSQNWRALKEGRESVIEIIGENHFDAKNPYLNFDNFNNPIITWNDFCEIGDTNSEICLTRWNPSLLRWEDMTGNPGTEKVADLGSVIFDKPIMIMDSTLTNPYIAWEARSGTNWDLYFTRWDGANWVKMDGTFGYENITSNPVSRISNFSSSKKMMSLDSANNPYLVWAQDSGVGADDIYFTKWTVNPIVCAPNPACWTHMDGLTLGFENLSNDAINSIRPSILLDSATNFPIVVWQNTLSNFDINLTRWDGANWTTMAGLPGYEKINNSFADFFQETGFVLNSANLPYLVWSESGVGVLFTKWKPGTGWTKMDDTLGYDIISSTGQSPSLILDAANNPYVVWVYLIAGQWDVFFSHWNGAQWATMAGLAGSENISSNSGNSRLPNIFLDSTSRPIIFWQDNTEAIGSGQDYFYTQWNGTNWVNIKNEPGYTNISQNIVSQSFSYYAAIDNTDNLFIIFNRIDPGANINLYFSHTGIPTNYYRTAQSLDIYTGSEQVTSATLTAVNQLMPIGTDIKYYFSNDNGYNWFNVIPGGTVNFPSSSPYLKWRARLMTTNTSLNPIINDLTIDYVISGGITGPIFPSAPINLTCEAMSTDTIHWNFEDTATNETGFKLYGPDGLILDTGEKITTDLSYLEESGLLTNTLYADRYVKTFNGAGESAASNTASCFTLANTPLKPIIGEINTESIVLKIDVNDGNPDYTEYAIKELKSGQYLNPDGTFSLTENWQTYVNWGGENGVVVSGEPLPVPEQQFNENLNSNVNAQVKISLAPGQRYDFAVKARNGDGVETAFSSAASGTTQEAGPILTQAPNIIATKGVGINLALNTSFNDTLIKIIKAADEAEELVIKSTTQKERMLLFLQEFCIFLILVSMILIIFLILSIHGVLKNLDKRVSFDKKAKLIWQLLVKEPAYVFLDNAQRDSKGTYQISYERHKRLQNFSQRNFRRIVGLLIIDIIILAIILNAINHKSRAQIELYNQSGQEVNVGDRLDYVIEFANSGNLMAGGLVIKDNLDSNLSYVAGSARIVKGGQKTREGININGNSLSFNVGDLGIGQSGAVYFSAKVKSGAEGQTILNLAQITGTNFANILTNTTANRVAEGVLPEEVVPQPEEVVPPPEVTPPTPPEVIPPEVTPPTPSLPPTGVTPPALVISPPTTKLPLVSTIIESKPVKYVQKNIIDNPQVEKVSRNVITPILLVLATINTIPAVIYLAVNVLPYLHLLFIEPFLLFFKKKRKKWGIVYDSLTKLPLGLAVVRLYRKKDNKLIQTKVTDKEGRYIMIVKEPGKYYLSVTKPDYFFPTKYLRAEKQDLKYLDLYHGEEIEVTQKESVVTANIPLDPKEKKVLTEKEAIRSYIIKNLRLIFSYLGMILALLIILIYPTIITVGSLVIHLILYLLFRRLIVPPKPKSWGIIYDLKTKEPLKHAIVRIFETRFNKLLETQVTDSKGRYAFLVGKNEYQLLAEKSGYQKKQIKGIDLIKKEEIVNLDVGLLKS